MSGCLPADGAHTGVLTTAARHIMTIDVLLAGESIPIDDKVFTTLLDNSVAGTYAGYTHALESRAIKFSGLVELARKGEIPYSLFFAPLALVEAQVASKTTKLLAGVSKETFSIGSRSRVELRSVELIVKDLIRKQQVLKKHDPTLARCDVVGMLRRTGKSTEEDAARLVGSLGLSHDQFRAARTKDRALELLIERLEANQILVARSVQNYMPQRLTHVRFSGLTIRDGKVPYVFLAGGGDGDQEEVVGRTIFTLALMTVLVARRIFAPVTWDDRKVETDLGTEYDIAGAVLMPADRLRQYRPSSLDDMKAASSDFKVTPSAVTVRAMRLGMIDSETARSHLTELRREWGVRDKPSRRRPIRPENAVRKYNGREFTSRMVGALDAGSISPGEFCRVVCLNHLGPSQIPDLRRALA